MEKLSFDVALGPIPPFTPNCFPSRVPLSVNGADDGSGRGNWGRNLLLLRARFSLFVRPQPAGAGNEGEGREAGGGFTSALSRLEWNRPRAKFLMERVCLPSASRAMRCDRGNARERKSFPSITALENTHLNACTQTNGSISKSWPSRVAKVPSGGPASLTLQNCQIDFPLSGRKQYLVGLSAS